MLDFAVLLCDPGEARTLDPLIKSQLLYQLSYGVIVVSALRGALFLNCGAKLRMFFQFTQFSGDFFRIFFSGNFFSCIFDCNFGYGLRYSRSAKPNKFVFALGLFVSLLSNLNERL